MIVAIVIVVLISWYAGLGGAARLNASPTIVDEPNDYGEKHRTS